jgi:hypothetical protein
VVDGLDVVAVRVEDEGRVVVATVGALARAAVVLSSRGERRGVELVYLSLAGGGKGDVRADVRRVAEANCERLVVVSAVANAEAQ